MMLTQDEYKKAEGTACPHCGSYDIIGAEVDIDNKKAYQGLSCGACHSTWTDVYVLQRFTSLEINDLSE